MDKIKNILILICTGIMLFSCASHKGAVKEGGKANDIVGLPPAFEEPVELNLERNAPGLQRMVGYNTAPGVPLRLPAQQIKVYFPQNQSPMGRLIGEHYVWAIVRPESYLTPNNSGLDTIVPTDIYRPDKKSK